MTKCRYREHHLCAWPNLLTLLVTFWICAALKDEVGPFLILAIIIALLTVVVM